MSYNSLTSRPNNHTALNFKLVQLLPFQTTETSSQNIAGRKQYFPCFLANWKIFACFHKGESFNLILMMGNIDQSIASSSMKMIEMVIIIWCCSFTCVVYTRRVNNRDVRPASQKSKSCPAPRKFANPAGRGKVDLNPLKIWINNACQVYPFHDKQHVILGWWLEKDDHNHDYEYNTCFLLILWYYE